MRTLFCLLVLTVAILLVSACGAEDRSEAFAMISLPSSAYDIDRRSLANGSAEQIHFKVKEQFPSIAPVSEIRNQLHELGWTKCRMADDWRVYIDATDQSKHIKIFDFSDYWIFNPDEYMVISAKYYENNVSAVAPNNEEQNILIWKRAAENLSDELAALRVNCDASE